MSYISCVMMVLLSLMTGCHKAKLPPKDQTPEETLSSYIDAQQHGDIQTAYNLLCAGEKSGKTFDKYKSEEPADHDFASHATYETTWVSHQKEIAIANVRVTSGAVSGKTMIVILKEPAGWRIFTGAKTGAKPGADLGAMPQRA